MKELNKERGTETENKLTQGEIRIMNEKEERERERERYCKWSRQIGGIIMRERGRKREERSERKDISKKERKK